MGMNHTEDSLLQIMKADAKYLLTSQHVQTTWKQYQKTGMDWRGFQSEMESIANRHPMRMGVERMKRILSHLSNMEA